MRLILLSLCAAAALIMVMNSAAAQTPGTQPTVSPSPLASTPAPSPTPNSIAECIDKVGVPCILDVSEEHGFWTATAVALKYYPLMTVAPVVLALGVFALFVFLFVKPFSKAAQDKNLEWIKSWRFFRSRQSPAEIQRREAEYLVALEQSEALRSPDETAQHLAAYLAKSDSLERPFKPSDEKDFVELKSGFEMLPRIGLSKPVDSGQSKLFTEQQTFATIAEVMNAVDENTGAPYPTLVLLGEPGAGKSTLLRKCGRGVLKKRLDDASAHLPFFVTLSSHKAGSPLDFLHREWKRMLGCDGLEEALAAGRVWLFADGLNEMPRARYDRQLAEWRDFLRENFRPDGNRALVACRKADYGEGIGAPRLVIHSMDDQHIQKFLEKRIPKHATALWDELKQDKEKGRGAIYKLAQIPYWLVLLTEQFGKTGLPRNRASLLDELITRWLDYETSRHEGYAPDKSQRGTFMDSLTRLAWKGLSSSQNYTFSLKQADQILSPRQSLVKAEDLRGLAQNISLISIEGEGQNKTLRFKHQLLQEYFAARQLKEQFVAGKKLRSKLRSKWCTPWRRWKFVSSQWDPLPPPPLTGWEEAVILAAGMLDPSQTEALALAVARDNRPLAARCVLESGVKPGDAAQLKIKQGLLQDLQNKRLRLPARLSAGAALARMGDPRLLERLHEFKNEGGQTSSYIEPDWVKIPEGTFTQGTTPQETRHLKSQGFRPSEDELPPHKVFISAFQMGRYPVTVAEYRCFMEAGGYQDDACWQGANALRWRNAPLPFAESYAAYQIKLLREDENLPAQLDALVKSGSWSPAQADNVREQLKMQDYDLKKQWEGYEAQVRNSEGRVVHPFGWGDDDLAVDNLPVVGVTWYEACAYAAWLTRTLQVQNRLGTEERLRLPSEAEWEKAVRGGRQDLWTWGSRWREENANTLEGRVMKPTPVGAYPGGASREGLLDLQGNVWEWCMDLYAADGYKTLAGQEVKNPRGAEAGNLRVLRGGSWNYYRRGARCASRSWYVPGFYYYGIGFRLVRSPSFVSDL